MTNEEAIEILQREDSVCIETDEALEAYELAIEALRNKPKKGKWETVEELLNERESKLDMVRCPFCKTIRQGRVRFCSWCGADMREDEA